jgi:acyl-CoA synthetase (AMP-forming)/AMP-acid ligase II
MNLLKRYRLARDRSLTVANLVDELLARNGDYEVSLEEDGPRNLAEMHSDVCALDAFLRRSVKLQLGQPVAIYRKNDRECIHWFLAVVRAGGIAVPLNPMLTLAEVRRILAESGTQILVTDKRTFETTIQERGNLDVRTWIQSDKQAETMDGFLRAPREGEPAIEAFPPRQIDPSATIAVFHTSGTSGFPKGAALSSRALLGSRGFSVLAGIFLGRSDLALIALPFSHIMAVSIVLLGMMAGVRGCFLDHFDVAAALEKIERLGVTSVVGVPTMYARLMNSNPDPARLKTVRVWLSASDHLPAELRQRLRAFGALLRLPGLRIPALLINGYGMVELGGMAMVGIELSLFPGSSERYIPVPPFRIRVADESGRTLPAGKTGECQIRNRSVRPHYWKDHGDSAGLVTEDGWLRTGDLAVRSRLGTVRLVGRMKEVIKSGGYSVYARELEEAIAAHPAVARAAAFGLPHKDKGEIPAAAVELRSGAQTTEKELLEWCREKLAPYKAPRRIWILDPGGLPQNHTGKVLRRELRERFSSAAN